MKKFDLAIKTILCSLLFLTNGITKAQNYGDNPEMCKQKLSIMTTYYKQKQYLAAENSWRYVYTNCPLASKNTFIIGSKILEKKIANTQDETVKNGLVDSLITLQYDRMKFFPSANESAVKAKIASYILSYKGKTDYEKGFLIYDSLLTDPSSKLSARDLKKYMFAYRRMVKNKKRSCEDLSNAFFKVEERIAELEKSKKVSQKAKDKINQYAEKCLSCEMLTQIVGSKIEEKKTDSLWLDNKIQLLRKRKCTKSATFTSLLESRSKLSPSATVFETLAQLYYEKSELSKAEQALKESIKLSPNNAAAHLFLAKIYMKKKSYLAAYAQAGKIKSDQPQYAEAQFIRGNAIAFSQRSCSASAFGGKEVYWLATDLYKKAIAADNGGKIKSKAQAKISEYKKYYPTQSEVFLKSLKDGQEYSIDCPVNAKTTVKIN